MPDNLSNGVRLIRLNPDHDIKSFDCDDADLNDFFISDSKSFSDQLLAVTYVIENDIETIAFFSILNDKVTIRDVGNPNLWEVIQSAFHSKKAFKSYPAVKIGRLGVNKGHKSQGHGSLIIDFLIDSFLNNNKTGCRFITVDAYQQSLTFYEKNNFKYLTDKDKNKDTRLMYLDLFLYRQPII